MDEICFYEIDGEQFSFVNRAPAPLDLDALDRALAAITVTQEESDANTAAEEPFTPEEWTLRFGPDEPCEDSGF